MSVKKHVSSNLKEITIGIDDRFDFSLHQLFRDSYIGEVAQGAVFTLDLSRTSYMDSSALGMILLLKDHAEKLSGSVIIKQPNESVAKILEIAQFHRLLKIEN
ncbi:STAS domain-containing protein [Thalassotalea euphylliae]|uniref:Anti-sigma factor antagonist n=1 Tax=Thalassotalea euphylliae TaxID=1655234 RepID=A0A3E0TYS2_9GAMM|nr:STAS domain-containing protein [Thalassotalea euphylliae]REL29768.1 anti-sigma factor antagonist [Thalassotalea euphylliae]